MQFLYFALLLAAAYAGPGYSGQKGTNPGYPPFLQNLSSSAQQQYYNIMRDDSKTIAQQQQDVNNWAMQNGIQDEVMQWHRQNDAMKQQAQQNVTQTIPTLSSMSQQMMSIMNNNNITRREQQQQLDALREQNPQAFAAIMVMMMPPKPILYPGDMGNGQMRMMGGNGNMMMSQPMYSRNGGY